MNKTTEALKLCVEALPNILFAATERDKKNRIRMFDNCVYQAQEALDVGREALAEPVCKRCNGTKLVSDGEINNIGGVDLEVPIECVKDCPDCAKPVKQEPVAVISESAIGLVKLHSNGACLPFGTQLYAAPVSAEAIRAEALEEAAKVASKASDNYEGAEIAAKIRGLK